MSSLRIRFRLNQQSGKSGRQTGGTKGIENFSRVIVDQVAFTYSENLFKLIKNTAEARMRADIQRELEHMARMFMTGVIGIAGRNRGPSGSLTTVAPASTAMQGTPQLSGVPVGGLTGNWARRSPKYLASRGNDTRWFQKHNPSVVERMRSSKFWTARFGGIRVDVRRHTSMDFDNDGSSGFKFTPHGFGGKTKIGVATIRVSAMNRITPNMLPALAGGGLGDFGPNPRSSGLLSMLGSDIANRLGGNRAEVPFRPTIQPFLSYFLTRQLPNAVFKRMEQGFQNQRWSRATDIGSAGRRG